MKLALAQWGGREPALLVGPSPSTPSCSCAFPGEEETSCTRCGTAIDYGDAELYNERLRVERGRLRTLQLPQTDSSVDTVPSPPILSNHRSTSFSPGLPLIDFLMNV